MENNFIRITSLSVIAGVAAMTSFGATVKEDLTVTPPKYEHRAYTKTQDWTQRTNRLFSLTAQGVDEIHLAYAGAPMPTLVLSNKTDAALALFGAIKLSGFDGTAYTYDAAGNLPAHACRAFPITQTLQKGLWSAVAALETPTAKAIAETRFAVMQHRDVTPPSAPGVFRAGFNYHMSRYTDADNAKCLKVLVQSGAKLVRAGVCAEFTSVARQDGTYNWERTDKYLTQLEKIGLAVNAIFYGTPRWAVAPKHRGQEGWQLPIEQGRFYKYAKDLATRYGTRIAWYEIGNEWDLLLPNCMSTEEAMALQREGYDGIKAGCPAAKVIPNGWAVVHSDVIPHRTQRNMQERLMTEMRHCCDAHTVHQHGPYAEYRRRLEQFFAWRKAKGINDMPWYSNETALTVAGAGEERVAECIWQKILCAWINGSVDYIWYNLRAIGFGPYDGEQGYGIVTGDFYPRASFPAFAGLMSCFEGLKPQKIVHQGLARDIYLFAGKRGGKDLQVIVGWDFRTKTNLPVRIKTDAKRAWLVDLFDNRREAPVVNGCVTWHFGKTPAAILLEDATTAQPEAEDLSRGETREIANITLGKTPHTFHLNDFDCVFEMYKADPQNFDRVWKGWWDLGGVIRIARAGDKLRITAEVRDETLASGDYLLAIVDGVETRFSRDKDLRYKLSATAYSNGAHYTGEIPFPKATAILELRLEDDDGKGKEGWMTTGKFTIK